jgi:uncharacterized protein YjiS (DUF1127 family)
LTAAIRRIVAGVGLRRGARSWQQSGELSDHLLKDIGLRREDVAYCKKVMEISEKFDTNLPAAHRPSLEI